MKKQRIGIVGEGLAGLMTALEINDMHTLDVKIKAKKISPIQIKSLRKKLANLDKNFKTGKVEFWKELKNIVVKFGYI